MSNCERGEEPPTPTATHTAEETSGMRHRTVGNCSPLGRRIVACVNKGTVSQCYLEHSRCLATIAVCVRIVTPRAIWARVYRGSVRSQYKKSSRAAGCDQQRHLASDAAHRNITVNATVPWAARLTAWQSCVRKKQGQYLKKKQKKTARQTRLYFPTDY